MADPSGAEVQRNMAWMRGNLEKTPKGMNPDIANMVRDVRNMYFPGENRPVGATPAMQSAVQGQPLPAAGEPVRPAPTMRSLAPGVAPQGQPRGYSGMAWSAPTATEVPGLGLQSATPDLSQIYNSPVGPKRAPPAVSPMAQKMSAPSQPQGFWDAATMGGGTVGEEAKTLGKLTGAAGILSGGAAAATNPLTLAAVLGGPLAAQFGRKELPASYAAGHREFVLGSTPAPHQAAGPPASEAFGRMRQLSADTAADTATAGTSAPAAADSLGRQITVRRGTNAPDVYGLDAQGNVTGLAQPAAGGAGLTPAERAYNTQLTRGMELENQRQAQINDELAYQLHRGGYGFTRPSPRMINALMGGKAAVSGAPAVPPKLKPPSEGDLLTGQGREINNQITSIAEDISQQTTNIQAAHPNWTPEQVATEATRLDPKFRQKVMRQKLLEEQLTRIIGLSGKKLPKLEEVMAKEYSEGR